MRTSSHAVILFTRRTRRAIRNGDRICGNGRRPRGDASRTCDYSCAARSSVQSKSRRARSGACSAPSSGGSETDVAQDAEYIV
jgi:hypothetical protein